MALEYLQINTYFNIYIYYIQSKRYAFNKFVNSLYIQVIANWNHELYIFINKKVTWHLEILQNGEQKLTAGF